MLAAPLALLWLLATPPVAPALLWAKVREPAPGEPRIYGGYASGCLTGAAALPLTGKGFEVMRPERVRHFGHPTLVDFVARLAATVEAEELGTVRVGDLSQPRGGPAPFGHASHQIGLDVDLAYALQPRPEGVFYEPMVDHKSKKPLKHFGRKQVRLLALAAQDPAVARIFVNPVIKRALCDDKGPDRAWRRKVRPWFGHDEHFHVRLACPADSPGCRSQAELPEGEGCEGLAWWFGARSRSDRVQAAENLGRRVRSRGAMPTECDDLMPAADEEVGSRLVRRPSPGWAAKSAPAAGDPGPPEHASDVGEAAANEPKAAAESTARHEVEGSSPEGGGARP